MENFRKVALALILLILTLGIVVSVNLAIMLDYREPYLNSYLASILDKEELLKKSTSPKIILVGGSNVAFGLDSRLISEKTGLPVVNAGIQGGLGIHFIMNSIKDNVEPGDILILSPEYHILLDSFKNAEILTDLLILYPQGFSSISTLKEVWEINKVLPAIHTDIVRNNLEIQLTHAPTPTPSLLNEKVYFRAAFDPETGDITTNTSDIAIPYTQTYQMEQSVPNPDLYANIRFLNEYASQMKAKGAQVYFLFPAIITIEDEETQIKLQNLNEILAQDLDMPLLNSWDEAQYPSVMIFDTAYHLNSQGREIHTLKLINEICGANSDLDCEQ